jgi:hypothetical protein
MSPRRIVRWKKTRDRGLVHFIVVHGVLLWACGSFALLTLFMFFTELWPRFLAHNVGQPLRTITALVLGGIVWALLVWFWEDWAYRRYMKKNSPDSDGAV